MELSLALDTHRRIATIPFQSEFLARSDRDRCSSEPYVATAGLSNDDSDNGGNANEDGFEEMHCGRLDTWSAILTVDS